MKISVVVHPRSRQARIEKDMLSQLHVYVQEPALKGKANLATIKVLAGHFKVKKNQIFLISGATSKTKLFEVKD